MAITLGDTTLSDHFLFENEFDWVPKTQSVDRSLTGAAIIQEAELTEGRPIVLSSAWETKAVVEDLYIKAAIPSAVYALDLHGRSFNVMFDFRNGSPIDADMVSANKTSIPSDSTLYEMKLYFLTVA